MKTWLYIGGPLILFTGLAFWTDFFTLPSEQPGIVHFSGVPMGGLFELNTKVYQCDENGNNCVLVEETTEVGEIGDLEFEELPIEYRNGTEGNYNSIKQPGIPKYTNIHLNRISDFDFDYSQWKFVLANDPDLINRQDGSIKLLDEDLTATDRLLDAESRKPDLPGPKFDEDAMEEVELEMEELQLEE